MEIENVYKDIQVEKQAMVNKQHAKFKKDLKKFKENEYNLYVNFNLKDKEDPNSKEKIEV